MLTKNIYKNVFTSLPRLRNIDNTLRKITSSPSARKYGSAFNTIKRHSVRNKNVLYQCKASYEISNTPFYDAVFRYACISSDLEDIRDDYNIDDRVSDWTKKYSHKSNVSSDLESLYRSYVTRKIKKYQLMKDTGRSIWTL